MSARNSLDDETRKGRQACAVGRRFVLGRDRWLMVVCADDSITTCELPEGREVTVGRSQGNHVCIDHDSVSREHVRLVLGDEAWVEDLGSTNGTSVAGQAITAHVPARVKPGDVIQVGSVSLVLQRLAVLAPRSVLTHDYFEARLEEECAKRARHGGTFCVVQVCVGRAADKDRTEAALHRALRAQDVVALYAPGEYEVLVDIEEQDVVKVTSRLDQMLRDEGIGARIGLARYPRDGRTAGDLIAHAHEVVHDVLPNVEPATKSALAGLDVLARRVASTQLSVLILGETGVGKEVMAEAIHRMSPRREKTFLRLNCAALTESLAESELFGHTRGAFTGAQTAKVGLLDTAEGGTVFLDEVGELSLNMQAKLLRVVEERRVTPVGGLQSHPIDVRFIAATNRDLEEEIRRGRFRQDLYFRLSVVTLVVPPLRERTHEILGLARKFAAHAAGPGAKPVFTAAAEQALLGYGWPGNIRELRNVVERAVLLSDGQPIDVRHLPERMGSSGVMVPAPGGLGSRSTQPKRRSLRPTETNPAVHESASVDSDANAQLPSSLRDDVRMLERKRIVDALDHCAGNQSKAAKLLGISRGTLIARIKQYGIKRPRS